MNNISQKDFYFLMRNSCIALTIGLVLVVLCYFFVDREVALYVHANLIFQKEWFAVPTHIPEIFLVLAPVAIITYLVVGAWRDHPYWLRLFYWMGVAIVFVWVIGAKLKLFFGRYWAFNWKKNLSLIHDNVYGFNFLNGNDLNNSFPSGHTMITVSVMTVAWILLPRFRWLWALICAAVMIGLIGANYHFVSDVIAGAIFGGIIGAYVAVFNGREQGTVNSRAAESASVLKGIN